MKNPEDHARPGDRVLLDLIRGWGNEDYAAPDEYLAACIRHALVARGPILECGSGLSTILIAVAAKRAGQDHWALEHTSIWATRVQEFLDRYELDSAVLAAAPLKDYGEFSWYAPPMERMPETFSLAVCDGPPTGTKGGRYGLAPVMKGRLAPGCVVLLDDAHREEERAIARRWQAELGATIRMVGSVRPYIEMTLS